MKQRMNLVILAPRAEQIPAMARDFLKFLLSQDGQDMVAKNGLVPIDPANIAGFIR
jgi:ABC-type phosphate transport system substrate-binding protein